jgi:hypothetical protein
MLIEELIGKAAPADYVLLAADRKPLTYAGLRSQSERTRTTLRDLGFR